MTSPLTPLTVIGPNLWKQDLGTFHVHAAGCADITKDPKHYGYKQVAAGSGGHLDFEVETFDEVVLAVYPPGDFDWDPANPAAFDVYRTEFHLAPCAVKALKSNQKETLMATADAPAEKKTVKVRLTLSQRRHILILAKTRRGIVPATEQRRKPYDYFVENGLATVANGVYKLTAEGKVRAKDIDPAKYAFEPKVRTKAESVDEQDTNA